LLQSEHLFHRFTDSPTILITFAIGCPRRRYHCLSLGDFGCLQFDLGNPWQELRD
jgi:hypothetical protein